MICIKDIIKRYGSNNSTIDILSDKLQEYIPESEYENLAKDIYESTQGKHFDEEFAKDQISKMYYEEEGRRYYAPYWNDVTSLYTINKKKLIHPYNKWDFEVALNMIKSDNCPILKQWFPEADEKELQEKVVELTINWLNDEDNPYGDTKIWSYFRK